LNKGRFDMKPDCEALWGEDWMAPLAEVLAVNRRTVERWRSGEIIIPARISDELCRLPRIGSAQRAYGDMLRRLARGETMANIEQWIADHKRAITRLKTDLGRYSAIAVLASGQRQD
jgi:hypothetical protein